MNLIQMTDLDLTGKRILIREDLNVPIKDGLIISDQRIQAALPTIKLALKQGAAVMVMSHLGRPKEGIAATEQTEFSLAPIATHLATLLGCPVRFEADWLNGVSVATGELVLLENVRCHTGEKADDEQLSKQMAALCDIYVMDAFGTAHRAQASTHGVAKFAPTACAGPLLVKELTALAKALDKPARPLVAIVGGAKVSTKLEILETLSDKVDQLIVGGGIANTFLAAAGNNVGKSLYEESLTGQAKNIMKCTNIPLPTDVVVAKEFSEHAASQVKSIAQIEPDDMILDIGPESAKELTNILKNAGTIIWNGPVGVFEIEQFADGTKAISHAIANSNAFSIAGGGDTLAAVDKFNVADKISYMSTGGGAFLEFVEGKQLPAVTILEARFNQR